MCTYLFNASVCFLCQWVAFNQFDFWIWCEKWLVLRQIFIKGCSVCCSIENCWETLAIQQFRAFIKFICLNESLKINSMLIFLSFSQYFRNELALASRPTRCWLALYILWDDHKKQSIICSISSIDPSINWNVWFSHIYSAVLLLNRRYYIGTDMREYEMAGPKVFVDLNTDWTRVFPIKERIIAG